MELFTFARVIHILSVVVWIGGVSMVTTVLIPYISKLKSSEDKLALFEKIENKFSTQAKITTVLTGLSGFYMLHTIDGWSRLIAIDYWWIQLMVLVWLIFTVILFIMEPLVLPKLIERYYKSHPDKVFKIMQIVHWVLLTLSMIAIVGGVAGGHGWYFWK